MKKLLHRKWFRTTAVIVLAATILLALAYTLASHRGAEALQRELAAAKAAGMPLTRAALDADMPPPERNAALHGLIHEWDLALARPDAPGADEALAPLRAFAKPSWTEPWRKPDRPRHHLSYRDRKKLQQEGAPEIAGPPPPDLPKGSASFWAMKLADGFGQDPVSFLAEFERRHGALLRHLQHDLTALPECRRPLAGSSPLVTDLSYDRLVHLCYPIHGALALRAEAALQSSQPALAAESIVLSLKLGSAIGSRAPEGTYTLQTSLHAAIRPLKAGITRHQWRAEDLDRITAALQAMDIRRATQRDIDAAVLVQQLWVQWKDDRHAFRNQAIGYMGLSDFRTLAHEFVRNGGGYLMPSGWFDWNASEVLLTARECHALAQTPGPLLPWWQGSQRMLHAYFPGNDTPRGDEKHALIFAYPDPADQLYTGARASVTRDQALAACALEKYYGEHRTYPATLPPGTPQDPLLEKPFAYKLKQQPQQPQQQPAETGFALYSLGPNTRDDGGSRKQGGTGDDWAW